MEGIASHLDIVLKNWGVIVASIVTGFFSFIGARYQANAKLKSKVDELQNKAIEEQNRVLNELKPLLEIALAQQDEINKKLKIFEADREMKQRVDAFSDSMIDAAHAAISDFKVQDSLSSLILTGTSLASSLFSELIKNDLSDWDRNRFHRRAYMLLKAVRNQYVNSIDIEVLRSIKSNIILPALQRLLDSLSTMANHSNESIFTESIDEFLLKFSIGVIADVITYKRKFDNETD